MQPSQWSIEHSAVGLGSRLCLYVRPQPGSVPYSGNEIEESLPPADDPQGPSQLLGSKTPFPLLASLSLQTKI